MSVQSLYMSNLISNLHSKSLRRDLCLQLPEVFGEEFDTEGVINIYQTSNGSVATVKNGFIYNFEKLELLFRHVRIMGRIVHIKPDYCDPRDSMGGIKNVRPVEEIREQDSLVGTSHKKTIEIFAPSLLTNVGRQVFEGHSKVVFVNTVSIETKKLMAVNGVYKVKKYYENDTSELMFYSILEALQGIVLVNKNGSLLLHQPPISLPICKSKRGAEFCRIDRQCGLGVNGEMIDVEYLSRTCGYIPFDAFAQKCLNQRYKERLVSFCWKCSQPYQICGINLNLNSFAGICLCIYANDEERCNELTAYSWPEEKFTRLILQSHMQRDGGADVNLVIGYYPIQSSYNTAADFCNIFRPLLEEEMYCLKRSFSKLHATKGIVQTVSFVETKARLTTYAMTLLLHNVSVGWNPDGKRIITNIRIEVPNEGTGIWYYGRVYDIKPSSCSTQVIVLLQIQMSQSHTSPYPMDPVRVRPTANTSEFKTQFRMMKEWVMKDKSSIFESLMLSCNFKNELDSDYVNNLVISSIASNPSENVVLERVENGLNTQQDLAYKRGKDRGISVIFGPPGTGKTKVLASLALWSALKEQKRVLLCAPSNYAADGLAQCACALWKNPVFHASIMRIYSRTFEDECFNRNGLGESNLPCKILHEDVMGSPTWKNNGKLHHILKMMRNGNRFCLTQSEKDMFATHKRSIEMSMLQNSSILVCTVGSLSDGRLAEFQESGVEIFTILVDEAGQLTQPAMMAFNSINFGRIVLAGDHQQLPPTVMSFAAKSAGLSKSLIEALSLTTLPDTGQIKGQWNTKLNCQGRMHPAIRLIVSKLTYNGDLVDSDSVLNRVPPAYLPLVLKLTRNRRVYWLDHNALESREGTSVANCGEADIIADFVSQLLSLGVPSSDITVLSLYELQRGVLTTRLSCHSVQVTNVDGFQGRENTIIIISLVRSNSGKFVGFTANQNRLNVAISRGRELLIFVGNLKFFNNVEQQLWERLLFFLKESEVIL